MAANTPSLDDSVNFLYRAMVERDPHKRRVKPVERHMLQLDFGGLDDSSDDSDFKVPEHDDEDSDSNESKNDDDDDDDDDEDDEEEEKDELESTEDSKSDGSTFRKKSGGLTVAELIEQARIKQAQARQRIAANDINHNQPKILICAVCLGDISEEEDEIVECDGCGVSVHEGCYGISDCESASSTISSSSTEPWFCEACRAGNKQPVCELCPNLGGIFKETDVGKWVHLVCALYIPGVAFGNVDKLTPVTLFEMPYSRWGAKACVLCEDERYSRTGVCIGCDAGMCRHYFHASCAQREGLLSEASPEEVREIADPFFAYCKLHADKAIVRSKRRNWLALQSHVKHKQALSHENTVENNRMNKKLQRYRVKYLESKSVNPQPWVPTQKMPRMLTSSPSACRKLIKKAELMGINTQTLQLQPLHIDNIVDIRKKWHISPSFTVEFVSYYLDRSERMMTMKTHLDDLLSENGQLQEQEQKMRRKYEELLEKHNSLKSVHSKMRESGVQLWKHINGVGAKKHNLPEVLRPKKVIVSPGKHNKKQDHDGSVALYKCGLCKRSSDQHMLAKCDVCQLFYHLGCLDPPLTRMPKKSKLQGWQCSECDKTDLEEKEVGSFDPNAPRKLREHTKEPAKFTPPHSCNGSSVSSASNDNGTVATPTSATAEVVKASRGGANGVGRRMKMARKTLGGKRLLKQSASAAVLKARVEKIQMIKGPVKRRRKMDKMMNVEKENPQKEATEPVVKKFKRDPVVLVVKSADARTECCRCKLLGSNSNLVRCDRCQKCYHFLCLDPPIRKTPKQRGYDWHCEDCDPSDGEDNAEKAEEGADKTKSTPPKKMKKEIKTKKSPLPPTVRRPRKKSIQD